MNNLYEVFGLDETATNEQITERYNALKEKYGKERFLEGEAGNEAAKKLTELNSAYSELMEFRRENASGDDSLFVEVEKAIREKDLVLAQQKLDSFNDRNARWHYLQSVVYYKKNWTNESKKQLEIAMKMDPDNAKYKSDYEKILNKMKSANDDAFKSGSGEQTQREFSSEDANPQMGGGSCLDFCCQMLACNMLLNCCCNCQ